MDLFRPRQGDMRFIELTEQIYLEYLDPSNNFPIQLSTKTSSALVVDTFSMSFPR